MPNSRTFSIVGASEETTAHIRLLLRMAGSRLRHRWNPHGSEEADLIVVEPQDARTTRAIQARCQTAGIPFAILCEQDDVVVHGMALRRPLKLDQLIAVFNAAGEARPDTDIVVGLDSDFYNAELGDGVPQGTKGGTWDQPEHAHVQVTVEPIVRVDTADTLDAFELLVHGDPLIEPEPKRPLVDENTRVEARHGGHTARHALRSEGDTASDAAILLGITPLEVLPISVSPGYPSSAESRLRFADDAGPVLPGMLGEGAVFSPVRLSGEGLPEVVLDPKLHRFYTRAQLHELAPYAEAGPDVVTSAALAGSELQRARESRIPRSFDELRWLFALNASKGRLDPRLDPGGSYCIRQALVAAPDLRAHGRIAALMTTPMPLHEVARASGARMEEVFDIVNAYHAIGRIEYIPRQRLQAQQAPQKPDKGGLFGLFKRK